MKESKPLPALAQSGLQMLNAQFQGALNKLGGECLDVMGLSLADGWRVNFQEGTVERETATPPVHTGRKR